MTKKKLIKIGIFLAICFVVCCLLLGVFMDLGLLGMSFSCGILMVASAISAALAFVSANSTKN